MSIFLRIYNEERTKHTDLPDLNRKDSSNEHWLEYAGMRLSSSMESCCPIDVDPDAWLIEFFEHVISDQEEHSHVDFKHLRSWFLRCLPGVLEYIESDPIGHVGFFLCGVEYNAWTEINRERILQRRAQVINFNY